MNTYEALNLMKLNNHRFSYCPHCQIPMIICGKCGNNSCNGGSKDECPDQCSEVYAIQDTISLCEYPMKYRIRFWIHYTVVMKFKIVKIKLYNLTHKD